MAATISLAAALRRVLGVPCGRMPGETVGLAAALGRHLRAAVCADGPWPSTDRSAMDGFAVMAASGLAAGTALPVVGESLAGHPFARSLPPGSAVRIMTGAVVPSGADAVVPVEQTSGFASNPVQLAAAVARGQNIRPLGSEANAGRIVIPAGRRIRAAEVGALAVLGHAIVEVHRRPVVAVLPTGDEVVQVDQVPLPHQVRESNSWALAAQIAEAGAEPRRLPVAADTEVELRRSLLAGLDADVLLTIGGISKGSHDLVPGLLRELGVAPEFHGIELKPGKPTFFGVRQEGERTTFVFGLPGNPASCFTVFDLLVRPLLERMLGGAPAAWAQAARLEGAWRPNARLQATPIRLTADGVVRVAELLPPSPSGDPFSLVGGNAYALLPEHSRPGELVQAVVVGYAANGPLP